ncbi:methyltransferase, TIGR04325 family [Laribacter hongkongensis]|uniref:methyltransferase, TIGR04325 family n=1 Tax=Laribacter hongkongensis TaxID=168471 RepID=UPI00187863CD|nr:methyltransferase, TIGR04325 family [Laribacter hongkongensis]
MLIKIKRVSNSINFLLSRLQTPTPDFYGVFSRFDQVQDENPWNQESWVNGNRAKLDALQIGHFSTHSSGPVSDQSHILLPALVINHLVKELRGERRVTVLDFGGGTGFSYFPISTYLSDKTKVQWNVFDKNQKLYQVGREYAERRRNLGVVDNIAFCNEFPEGAVDVIHGASVLEYIDNDIGLLTYLAERYKPKYFLMTRIKGGNIDTFVTRQVVGGSSTPCRFSNVPNLIATFEKLGYGVMLNAPCGSFEASQFLDIPEHLQIRRSVDLVLRRHG